MPTGDADGLMERRRALHERQTALEEQQAKLARELAEVEELIDADTDAKRPRLAGAPGAPLEPKSWRTFTELQAHVIAQRAAGKLLPFGSPGRVPRVYVDGCFDMMHSGHMNAVRQAKLIAESCGGVLVVGVHSDVEIEVNKGPPVMHDDERLALVSAVKWVDELVFDTPYTPTMEFLDSIDCDYVVHGDDLSGGTYDLVQAAGRLKVVKRTEGVSTTDLVGRLLLLTRSHHEPVVQPPAPSGADVVPAAVAYTRANISSSGVSQFLPTTWRLRQFSNGRVARPGQKVVYVDGAFDLLHAGHVRTLYAARNRGDFLLVGLHDDATVNEARGQNQPICSLHERALCVLALACVDEVILGAPRVMSADLIKSMNIELVVTDADDVAAPPTNGQLGASVEDRFAVPRELGILHEGEMRHSLRLCDIVARIMENRARYEARNAKREKKELNYMLNQKTFIAEL